MTARVGLLVFDGFDLLDVGGPYEVLSTANRCAAADGDDPPFAISIVGLTAAPVTAHGGLQVVPGVREGDTGPLDLLVVPGAVDIDLVLAEERLVVALADLVERSGVVASVCTGAFLLAELGLLAGHAATTHHEDREALARRDVGEVVGGVRWVDTGPVVTGAGPASGLDTALHLVDRFASRALAEATAARIEYDWHPDAGRTLR